MNKKTLKEQLERFSWYELMTNLTFIELYVEHIREEPVPYECKDEEKERIMSGDRYIDIRHRRPLAESLRRQIPPPAAV